MARANGDPGYEDVDGTEADVADVLDQAEPASARPVETALEERERIPAGDPDEDERERDDANEAAGGA